MPPETPRTTRGRVPGGDAASWSEPGAVLALGGVLVRS